MKNLIFLILLSFLALNVNAGTCTSDSYTAASANSVLTSTKYNSDNSTLYDRLAGNFDGGCIVDNTLEITATDSSWDPLKDHLQGGCKISYSSASTVAISPCALAVDGEFVNTATTTTVSFGCGSCSTETASTTFYVYVADGSSSTTLTPLILSTVPNDNGYDSNNNRVLGSFRNDGSSDIEQNSFKQWAINDIIDSDTNHVLAGVEYPTNQTWNGKRVYAKSWQDTSLPNATVLVLAANFDHFIKHEGNFLSGPNYQPLPLNDGTTIVNVIENASGDIVINAGATYTYGSLTVYYTK